MAFLLASILCMVILFDRITPQKVPPNFKRYTFEKYNNTYILPDGYEATIFQRQGKEVRQYFIVREADALSITVTPCASSLKWSIYFRTLDQPQNTTSPGNLVTSYNGDLVQTYNVDKPRSGAYIISLTSLDRDSSLKILATTRIYDETSCYPKISDTSVKVESLDRSSVRLSWQAAVATTSHNHPVKYCVSVNTRKQFRSYCSASANIFGDKPISLPGIRFKWQKYKIAPLEPAPPGQSYMECLRNRTVYDVLRLEPSTLYYFDVFAVSLYNNRSTTYGGAKYVTKPPKESTELKTGKTHIVRVKDTPYRSTSFYTFSLKKKFKHVKISLQPCGEGKLTVEIYRGRRLIQQGRVKGFKVIKLKKVRPGKYHIKIRNNKRNLRTLKMGVFTRKAGYPYPNVPKNTKLKIFSPTCNSFTVAWFAGRQRQRYCLYVRKLTNSLGTLAGQSRTQCGSRTKPSGHRIFCKKYRAKNKSPTPESYRVQGLDRRTTYIVDLYVFGKGNKEALSYRTQTAHTKHECR